MIVKGRVLMDEIPTDVAVKMTLSKIYAPNKNYRELSKKAKQKFKDSLSRMVFEASIQYSLRHPNAVECYGVDVSARPFRMLVEYYHGGTLVNHLRDRGPELKPVEKFSYGGNWQRFEVSFLRIG